MKYIALLGAGFSRNWGGWLAAEAFEYLLASPEIDDPLRTVLWRHRRKEGFEGALGELQDEYSRNPSPLTRERLGRLERALAQMFSDMLKGFESVEFEFQNQREYQVATFLHRFDAIFTLNQDLLLELHYLNNNVGLSSSRRWTGWQLFGVRPQSATAANPLKPSGNNTDIWVPGGHQEIQPGYQPYVKLHGSSNWRGTNDASIMVLGTRKRASIDYSGILNKFHALFRDLLTSGPVRLMVIGYGFGDEHINEVISAAAAAGNLEVFIVDPLGIDVADANRSLSIYVPSNLLTTLEPHIIGASRRTFRETFGTDRVEHAKVMAFFRGR